MQLCVFSPSKVAVAFLLITHSPGVCSVFGIDSETVESHLLHIPDFSPSAVQLGSFIVSQFSTVCPKGSPSDLPQTEHFFASVQFAWIQSCPLGSPSVSPQSEQVFGAVQVASFHV